MWFFIGKISPLGKIEGVKTARLIADHLRMTLKKKDEGAFGAADVDRLPQAVQHKNGFIEQTGHAPRNGPEPSIPGKTLSIVRTEQSRKSLTRKPFAKAVGIFLIS